MFPKNVHQTWVSDLPIYVQENRTILNRNVCLINTLVLISNLNTGNCAKCSPTVDNIQKKGKQPPRGSVRGEAHVVESAVHRCLSDKKKTCTSMVSQFIPSTRIRFHPDFVLSWKQSETRPIHLIHRRTFFFKHIDKWAPLIKNLKHLQFYNTHESSHFLNRSDLIETSFPAIVRTSCCLPHIKTFLSPKPNDHTLRRTQLTLTLNSAKLSN